MPESLFDPSMNILHRPYRELDAIFSPKSVAVIGASERIGSVGRTLVTNLLKNPFGGVIFPINPKRSSIMGLKAYPSIDQIKEPIDLAIIVTPAKTVSRLVEECVKAKVRGIIIISAGFKEMGDPGIKLEKTIQQLVAGKNTRIIGPNCLGIMNPIFGINATFAADMAHAGNLAFISQSGALITAVLDWSLKQKVGFSSVVSIGSMLDISWGDLIDYFGSDPHTESILIYMESIGNPRAFLSAAREVARTKPIILIKAGKSAESAKAAASHTGALSGSDDVLNAALARAGVLRVDTIADLFSMADVLSKQPRAKGPRLSIVTNAGGPGVIATDALIENQGELAQISPSTHQELDALLPPQWSRNNPIDILGDASPEIYGKAVTIAQRDEESDGTLVILTPQDMTDPTTSAQHLTQRQNGEKPLLASWMGGAIVEQGIDLLNRAKIPTFEYPDEAAKAFGYMWRYNYNLQGLYETPKKFAEISSKKVEERNAFIQQTRQKASRENRTILTEYEAKKLLQLYGIPTALTTIASSKKEAVTEAKNIGFPVVLKLHSSTITHKSDVGGVQLNLQTEEEVEKAYDSIYENVAKKASSSDFSGVSVQPMISLSEGYELIVGSSVDPEFGPTILFGLGGSLVEVFQDRALALPPLTSTLAKRMMEKTKIYQALQGVRGKKGVSMQKLEALLVQFSHMLSNEPWIKECDINPLFVSSETIIALDARVVLYEPEEKPVPLAIRPYPEGWVSSHTTKQGATITIRPITPEDEPMIAEFYKELSEESIRLRYVQSFHYDERTAHERLTRICFNDHERDIALIAVKDEALGIARLSKIPGSKRAVFTMIVKDTKQNQGIGAALLQSVLTIAKKEAIDLIFAELLEENHQMKAVLQKFGFTVEKGKERLFATLDLSK